MHLLYLDESGNENDAADRYFVLGGLALFERQTYHLTQSIESIQQRHFPTAPPVHFHANEIRSGRGFWREVPDDVRAQVLEDIADAIVAVPPQGRALFAAAIEKHSGLYGEAAVEKATEEVCRRFDMRLTRLYHQNRTDAQRGLLIFSEGRFDARAKLWVRDFHRRGTSWGAINNLADIPYFASTRESRPLQAADFVSHAVWLLYEKHDPLLISRLITSFDMHDGRLHGLSHVRAPVPGQCGCPACSSRRTPGALGDWVH